MSYRKNKIITLITILFVMLFGSYSESSAQFGKNKVQYDVFDWKYIESKHFDVYYDDGIKYLAKFTALSAEKALISIQETLNFNLDSRVVIVIYASHNEFQQTNVVMTFMPEGVGGVTELFKNRVVVPFQGDYSQLRHVIHHELVHAVVNEMFYGGTLQTSISTGNMVQIPLWMNEGLCEWESIGGMNTETDMFMRDLTISENLPPLTRFGGYLAYRGGQTFYWYIAQKYGPQRVGELINRLKISRTVEAAFQATFNEKIEDFSEDFEKYLKKYYWTDLDVFVDPEEFSVPLTDHEEDRNFYNTSPAISPNGEKMAFISDEDGIFKIFVQDLQDKESRREIVSSFRQQDFEDLNILTPGISWSPDGKMLAISAKAGSEDAVFLVDVESEDYDKLTFGLKSITSVVWSPDGDKLAFIGTTNGIQSDIFIYNLEKEQLKNASNDIFSDQYPVWSPDSKMIYFISDRGEYTDKRYAGDNFDMWSYDFEKTDIYSLSLESGAVERITFDPEFKKTSIAVSPAGDELLFVSDKNGIGNIYSIDLQTGNTRAKTNSLNGISQLSLSKDGSKLLFSVLIGGGYDIHMMRYPLEKKLDIDELPLTKFRKQYMEKKQYMSDLAEEFANLDEEKEDKQFEGYGDFNIEFSEQELINPNIDAAERDSEVAREAIKGQDHRDTLFAEND